MRIGIDARFFGPIGKGLGRYTQKLIENLEKIDSTNHYFVFLKAENFDEYEPKNKNFQKVLADFRWYTLSEQINFSSLLKKYKLDLVHFPHFNVPLLYRKKFVVTIHDLILVHFPTIRSSTLHPLFYWLKFLAYKIVIRSAIGRAQRIIAVSNFTKNDLIKTYPKIKPEKIKVTYESAEDFCLFTPEKKYDEILARYGIMKPYVVYVGNAYPHKNLEKLILSFREIKKAEKKLNLILVGKEDYFYRRLKNFSNEQKIQGVIFTDYIPDHELDTIFRNASAFVWPTLYEGFGLPPLEAMSKGVPVVSSDQECMKEILSDSAYYFDGRNIADMAGAVIKVLNDSGLRERLISNGYERVTQYSWKRMAKETLELYKKFHLRHPVE
jgi:glycosyltransferase involved in cell wall biosynthesis